jgi:YD repeat-containing protein
MKLTVEWLKDNNACQDGIDFAIRNKLIGFPFELFDSIVGDDIEGFYTWFKFNINNILNYEYENNTKKITITKVYFGLNYSMISTTDDNVVEDETISVTQFIYDNNNNLIYEVDMDGYIYEYQYDENNNLVYELHKDGTGKSNYTYSRVMEYNEHNKLTHFKSSMNTENWYEYDENNNLIHCVSEKDEHTWYEYDENNNLVVMKCGDYTEWYTYDHKGNKISYKTSDGQEQSYSIEYYPDGQLKQYNGMYIPYFNKD